MNKLNAPTIAAVSASSRGVGPVCIQDAHGGKTPPHGGGGCAFHQSPKAANAKKTTATTSQPRLMRIRVDLADSYEKVCRVPTLNSTKKKEENPTV